MAAYGEPDWATPGDTTNMASVSAGLPAPVTVSTTSSTNTQNANTADERNKARCVILGLSALNMGLSAMMGALGVLSLIGYKPSSAKNLSAAFLPCYMIIFACLLFSYEFIWWQPVAYLNVMFRKNFGFFYGLQSKGFYLILIAFLTLGLLDQAATKHSLAYGTGIAWLASGILHIFVACTMPEVKAIYKPPTAGLAQLGQQEAINPV